MKSDLERDPNNGIALQQITLKPDGNVNQSHANPSFHMENESESGPPPYPGRENGQIASTSTSNGDVCQREITPTSSSTDQTGNDLSSLNSPRSNVSSNGEIQKLDSLLSVEGIALDKRKRHKSEGCVPSSPNAKAFLDPSNLRKNSMYESKSTISGVKFDDSFIGEYSNAYSAQLF